MQELGSCRAAQENRAGQGGKDWLLRAKERASGGAVVTLWDQNATWYDGTPIR